jgi:acetaldehyde dehydrogenase (acetylating)
VKRDDTTALSTPVDAGRRGNAHERLPAVAAGARCAHGEVAEVEDRLPAAGAVRLSVWPGTRAEADGFDDLTRRTIAAAGRGQRNQDEA